MATSYELIQERSKYYAFIEQLNQTAAKVKEALNYVTELKSKVEESYKVDEESGDRRVIQKEIDNLKNMLHNISDIMVPSCTNRVTQLSRNIQIAENNERIKAEQEAEKKRRALENAVR